MTGNLAIEERACAWRTIALAMMTLAASVSCSEASAQEPEPGRPPGLLQPPGQAVPGRGERIDPRRMPPELTTVPSDVRDRVDLFSRGAVRSARQALERIERSVGAPILIETIESLDGEDIDQVAARMARRAGSQGVFVLLARKDAKLEVLPSRRYSEALPREARAKVRAAFIEHFRDKDFDGGLREGIAALETELLAGKKAGKLPQPEQADIGEEMRKRGFLPDPSTPGQPGQARGESAHALVRRDRIHLTLEGARTIIAAASRQATSMKLKVNIAVVDDGGHLLSFDRMDDARPASGYTAITKATTAATFRQPTGPIPAGTTNPDPLLNLSLQLAAQAGGGKITTLYGGVPVVVDEQVIGGVGVGGGSGEQDATIARAGIQAFLDALRPAAPREAPDERR